mmetsp:Transcript_6262/g.15947  ORF Transcript_6262/g.15947 Transcript_6262/m.15947 type:complete len:143 (-) Transcript_6262:108-536(-)
MKPLQALDRLLPDLVVRSAGYVGASAALVPPAAMTDFTKAEEGEDDAPRGLQLNVAPYVSHYVQVRKQADQILDVDAEAMRQMHALEVRLRPMKCPESVDMIKRFRGDMKGIMHGFKKHISGIRPAVVGAANIPTNDADNDE